MGKEKKRGDPLDQIRTTNKNNKFSNSFKVEGTIIETTTRKGDEVNYS